MSKRQGVWVVESFAERRHPYGRNNSWAPTVGAALTYADARRVLAEWRDRNPDDRFRLVRYLASR